MILATVETRNFTFEAMGETKEEAVSAVKKGWLRHQRETGATLTWEEIQKEILETHEFVLGRCYRDGIEI